MSGKPFNLCHWQIKIDVVNRGETAVAVPARKWGNTGFEIKPVDGNLSRITNGEHCATAAEAWRRRIAWRERRLNDLVQQTESHERFLAAARLALADAERESMAVPA